ncbi:MAG: phosphonate ABC transporter ATP-binding protein [Bdellovibrionaceae bacterium]|nr:phosphonate ABC transporter ATP-binding protein [Bdellovibrio sp.]
MPNVILEIKNLKKTYPNGVRGLRGVSFQVLRGEFLVIIGLSGSGKSTLLRCINRLTDATNGQIKISIDQTAEKVDVTKFKSPTAIRALRKSIGMIFQQFNLVPRHTVIKNVLMGKLATTTTLKSILGLFSVADRTEALNYLELVGIADKAYLRADHLSGGQQQRVAIARALMQKPQILLADEPVASLDPATSHTVMNYLKKVNHELGITIICNLHDLSIVRQYATRVIALKDGEIVFEGSPLAINEDWFQKIYGIGALEKEIG